MMPSRKSLLVAAVVALSASLLAHGAYAQSPAPTKADALIKLRQSAFNVVGWHCSRIKTNVEGQYNKEEVVKSANAIASIVNGDLFPQFAAGTEQGKGWHDTAFKAEGLDSKRFAELAGNLRADSSELARLASSSADVASVKTQFTKVAQSCRSCHDDFRRKD